MTQVSGLWQYRQRRAHPWRKTTARTPGPSTRPWTPGSGSGPKSCGTIPPLQKRKADNPGFPRPDGRLFSHHTPCGGSTLSVSHMMYHLYHGPPLFVNKKAPIFFVQTVKNTSFIFLPLVILTRHRYNIIKQCAEVLRGAEWFRLLCALFAHMILEGLAWTHPSFWSFWPTDRNRGGEGRRRPEAGSAQRGSGALPALWGHSHHPGHGGPGAGGGQAGFCPSGSGGRGCPPGRSPWISSPEAPPPTA